MNAFNWLVAPTLAGCSPASIWAAMPRFPIPTQVSQTVSTTLPKSVPFILVNDYDSSQTGFVLLMISAGATGTARHSEASYSIRITFNGTTVSAKTPLNVPSGQETMYLVYFQRGIENFSGIYPI